MLRALLDSPHALSTVLALMVVLLVAAVWVLWPDED